jgi:transcription elongation factor/antiterminator RfaH
MKTWYAIYTKARNEKKVAELLSRSDIENFLPLMKRQRIWSDRKKIVEEPLFSSYIFVHISPQEHLQVLQTPGVVRFISFEGQKVPVRALQIEAIRQFVLTGEDITLDESEYTLGKKVRVISGSMKGLEGRLINHLGHQRVKVEIDAIRHSIFITIAMASLEIIN